MKLHSNPVKNQIAASDFCVRVNGEKLELFRAFGQVKTADMPVPYAFGSFDLVSGAAEIEITSARDLSQAQILPAKNTLKILCKEKNKLVLKADKPFIISIEPEGRTKMPLLLFGKAPETNVPDKSDPNVIWFGPGEHTPDRINLKSNQTLYLESGALVHAVLYAQGDNIRVCGRGVLSQEKFPRGYSCFAMDFRHCRNLTIEGIINKDPCFWNLTLRDCRDVKIDGIGLCGSLMLNDDAFDLCNCQNVKVENCFFRAQDDVIAIKGEPDLPELPNNPCVYEKFGAAEMLDPKHYTPDRTVENVEIANCVFWNDSANVFRIGFECVAPYFRNFRFHDIEVIHAAKIYKPHTDFWSNNVFMLQASCNILMEDMRFERINVHSDGLEMLFMALRAEECGVWKKTGVIRNVLFKDVSVTGSAGKFKGEIFFRSNGPDGRIEGITFDNVSYFGKTLNAENIPFYTEGNIEKPKFIK